MQALFFASIGMAFVSLADLVRRHRHLARAQAVVGVAMRNRP